MENFDNSASWFYADEARQQHGPVMADALQALLAQGQIHRDTLVWREGMSSWQPLGEVAELLPVTTPSVLPSSGIGDVAQSTPTMVAVQTNSHQPEPLPGQTAWMAQGQAGAVEIDRSDIVYAGFWRRFAAYWLDSMVLGMLSYIIILPAAMILGFSMESAASGEPSTGLVLGIMLPTYLLVFLLQALYFAWMHSRPAQASLGKMAIGIKVCDENGERISFGRGFARFFALILAALPFNIGLIIAGFTDKKRGLHDMMCKTLVVDKWAYTTMPHMQKRKLDGVTIALLAILAVFLVFGTLVMAFMSFIMLGDGAWLSP